MIFRELREAHDRTTARWPAAPWMLARAFAKHVKGQHVFRFSTREHGHARCEKWAHIHFFASVRFALHERSSLTSGSAAHYLTSYALVR